MPSPVKIPARASIDQAKYTIQQKLVDKDRKLTSQDRRRLQDQYAELASKEFAKGGSVTKSKAAPKKKKKK